MRTNGNKIYRETTSRMEEAASVDQELLRMEDAIRKLKIDFDIFFNGGAKRPPLESRARTEAQIKRLVDDRRITYAQRYKLNSIVSRYTSFRELWRRMLKARGEELL